MLLAKDQSALHEISLFRELTPEQLACVSELLHSKTFPAGSYIFTEEQRGEVVYFIHRGTIKIHIEQVNGEDVILNIIGPGDVLGDMSVLDGLGRSANAVTLEESALFWMDCDDFNQCLLTLPQFSYNMARILSRRLRLASTRIQMLSTLDVYGRVAHQILAFARIYGVAGENGSTCIPIRLTQTDLAHLVGASRVRVNQVLVTFKKLKYISVDSNYRISVHNPEALAKRCG
jgi:CRP/FNR family cyclic AMP-dependent transcriptional regulator